MGRRSFAPRSGCILLYYTGRSIWGAVICSGLVVADCYTWYCGYQRVGEFIVLQTSIFLPFWALSNTPNLSQCLCNHKSYREASGSTVNFDNVMTEFIVKKLTSICFFVYNNNKIPKWSNAGNKLVRDKTWGRPWPTGG